MIYFYFQVTIKRPGAVHRARWMAKAIYTLKMELLFDENKAIMTLSNKQVKAMHRFNHFVVTIYLQSWFTCRDTKNAPLNDIHLIQRLKAYSDEKIKAKGLKMMVRHSGYLTPELSALVLFSPLVTVNQKKTLISTMTSERGTRLIADVKNLPNTVEDLKVSSSLFEILGISDILQIPVEDWGNNAKYESVKKQVFNIPCVNDCAERGVALIEEFNKSCQDENQKQWLLQVVERHRREFGVNRKHLVNM